VKLLKVKRRARDLQRSIRMEREITEEVEAGAEEPVENVEVSEVEIEGEIDLRLHTIIGDLIIRRETSIKLKETRTKKVSKSRGEPMLAADSTKRLMRTRTTTSTSTVQDPRGKELWSQ
jgi:hypothetical protein